MFPIRSARSRGLDGRRETQQKQVTSHDWMGDNEASGVNFN